MKSNTNPSDDPSTAFYQSVHNTSLILISHSISG